MFYTSLITSLLPYILLTGIFGTLLINHVTISKRTDREKINYTASPKEQAINNSRTFFYGAEENKDKKINAGNTSTFWLSAKASEVLRKEKKHYPPCKIPLISNPDLNSTYSFRGPPSLLYFSDCEFV